MLVKMDDEEGTTSTTTNKTRERILDNEMRSFKNRGFHDGYEEGRRGVIQQAFDAGYQTAFEQNFVLSTLKGVAHALKSPTISTTPTPSTSSSSTTSSGRDSSSMNVHISSNHLSMLESMKFDNADDIESIKSDLIKICRENRLEILAHYVSNIG